MERMMRATPKMSERWDPFYTDRIHDAQVDAELKFDPARGVPLPALKAMYARWAVMRARFDATKRPSMMYLDTDTHVVADTDQLTVVVERERLQQLDRAINKLSDNERDVVRLHWLSGFTLQATGRALGLTRQRVLQISDAALDNIRRLMWGYENG